MICPVPMQAVAEMPVRSAAAASIPGGRISVSGAGRSSEIDALRCVAMTAVIILHCGLMPFGWAGVWLFFVISGYVVTKSMLHRGGEAGGMRKFGDFLRRRTLRIMPIYYLYVAIGLAFSAVLGLACPPITVASLLGFFNNIAMILGKGELAGWPIGHLWTISTEMQFYALYGIALCFLSRAAIIRLLIVFIIASPAARVVVSLWLDQHHWLAEPRAYAIYAGPMLHFDSFAMGGMLAFVGDRRPIGAIARPIFLSGMVALGLFLIAYMVINHIVLGRHGIDIARDIVSGILVGQYRELFLYSIVGLVSTGLVALAIARDDWLQWFAKGRLLQSIGVISYGGYIYHAFVIRGVKLIIAAVGPLSAAPEVVRHLMAFAIGYPATLAVAWLSYRFLEQPLIRYFSPKRD